MNFFLKFAGGDAFDRIDQSLEAARASQKVWGDDGMPLGSSTRKAELDVNNARPIQIVYTAH